MNEKLEKLFELSKHFLKIYNRNFIRYFFETHTLDNRFSIIIGQRGVGKSTALIQYLLKYSNHNIFSNKILYIQSDHFLINNYSLYEIAEEFYKYGGELICFDEVHKYAQWSRELKSIYDTFPKLKIIASGSSILEITKGSHDLSRRAVVYNINGMSFREFIAMYKGIELAPISLNEIIINHQVNTDKIVLAVEKQNLKILSLFEDYLKFGYYPYFLEFNNTAKFHITLEQQIHTTIESDLLSVYPNLTGDSMRKLKKLLSAISENVPFLIDYKKIMNIVNVSDNRTIKTYLKYLEDAGVIIQLAKSGKTMSSLEKVEKIYINNTNQIYALNSVAVENKGTIRETFFANMFMTQGKITLPKKGDFLFDNTYIFEVGGRNKNQKQIKNIENSFLALDGIEHGINNKIPLWLFGFMY